MYNELTNLKYVQYAPGLPAEVFKNHRKKAFDVDYVCR